MTNTRIAEILRDMEALHARTFAPIREILDRLPKSEPHIVPGLSEALAPRSAPTVVVNIFINQDCEQ